MISEIRELRAANYDLHEESKTLRQRVKALEAECTRSSIGWDETNIAALEQRKRAEAAEAWKQEQIAVERTWNPQRVASLIGCPLGSAIRPQIEPYIIDLQNKVNAAEKEVTRLNHVDRLNCELDQQCENYSLQNRNLEAKAKQLAGALQQIAKQPIEPAYIYDIAYRIKSIAKAALEI
jgi:chromosome segregation ATPase